SRGVGSGRRVHLGRSERDVECLLGARGQNDFLDATSLGGKIVDDHDMTPRSQTALGRRGKGGPSGDPNENRARSTKRERRDAREEPREPSLRVRPRVLRRRRHRKDAIAILGRARKITKTLPHISYIKQKNEIQLV